MGGAVFAGMGLIAPAFSVTSTSFMTNLPIYAGKAGYTALSGAASTGAGMFTSDMFDNGQIDYSGKDYLKAIGTAGLLSGGISFVGSLIDYGTWDRLDIPKKMDKLRRKFGNNLQYDPNATSYGYFDPNKSFSDGYIGPDALVDKGMAYSAAQHELKHVADFNSILKSNLKPTAEQQANFLNYMEKRAYLYGMKQMRLSSKYWLHLNNALRGVVGFPGYGYNGINFSFGLDQLWNSFF